MRIPLFAFLTFLLTCTPTMVCAEEVLGRLFFTPEKRAVLERQCQMNIQVQETHTLEGATVHLNGIIQRSSGKKTVWINGVPQNDNATPLGVAAKIAPGDPARASLSAEGESPANLKVGETINRATREKDNGLEGGTIVVGKPSARARDALRP